MRKKERARQHDQSLMAAGANTGPLAEGRLHFARRAWAEASRCFARADQVATLDVSDLERYAWSVSMCGRDDDAFLLLERLYLVHLDHGDRASAARFAFWHGMRLLALGSAGRSSGWLARAQRLAEQQDCAARGYVLIPQIYRALAEGDLEEAQTTAATAVEIADRFGDADLRALASSLLGCACLRQGDIAAGLCALDEAMVAATSDELTPAATGLVYCNVLAGCQAVYALDRSQEWTAAFTAWCDSQPDLVPFSSACLVYRAELMQWAGFWPEAMAEACRAERVAAAARGESAADAYYQQAEIHRLRGDYAAAETAYRSASQHGRDPQPGMALLRLGQGRAREAARSIRLALGVTSDRLHRARLLPASIEIMIATANLDEARKARDELVSLAQQFRTEVLGAMAAHATAAVALAEGEPAAALEPLRRSLRVWQHAETPYIVARQRLLLALTYRQLGDEDSARLELDLAREVFTRLGAAPDLAGLEEQRLSPAPDTPLSAREVEVLHLLASGKTNKAIARSLYLSEKTIDRHVSNIFHKIDVASRSAATAYAYETGLVTKTDAQAK